MATARGNVILTDDLRFDVLGLVSIALPVRGSGTMMMSTNGMPWGRFSTATRQLSEQRPR
jgi:hypothetical protein